MTLWALCRWVKIDANAGLSALGEGYGANWSHAHENSLSPWELSDEPDIARSLAGHRHLQGAALR